MTHTIGRRPERGRFSVHFSIASAIATGCDIPIWPYSWDRLAEERSGLVAVAFGLAIEKHLRVPATRLGLSDLVR